jgi:hypothetical protein
VGRLRHYAGNPGDQYSSNGCTLSLQHGTSTTLLHHMKRTIVLVTVMLAFAQTVHGVTCQNDTYLSHENTCLPCPGNSSSVNATHAAVHDCKCNVGYTGQDGGECKACIPGKYKPVAGSAGCTVCPAGTFLSKAGGIELADCKTCKLGTYSATAGSTSATSCLGGWCAAGNRQEEH